MRALVLLALFLLASCHRGARTTPSGAVAPADVPAGLLAAPEGAFRSIVVRDGAPYLFVSFAYGLERVADAGMTVPECWETYADAASCPKSLAANETLRASVPAPPEHVGLITSTGPCEATVADLFVLDTHGCEASTTLAYRLTGCTLPVASIGRVDGDFDADLRFMPAPAPTNVRPLDTAAVRALSNERYRARVLAWLDEPALSPLQDANADNVRLDAGGDVLETSAASFLVGTAEDACGQSLERRSDTTLVRDGALVPVELDDEWRGVLVYRGRIVGIFLNTEHETDLRALAADGTLTEVFEERVWSDNEECTSNRLAELEHPCGP